MRYEDNLDADGPTRFSKKEDDERNKERILRAIEVKYRGSDIVMAEVALPLWATEKRQPSRDC